MVLLIIEKVSRNCIDNCSNLINFIVCIALLQQILSFSKHKKCNQYFKCANRCNKVCFSGKKKKLKGMLTNGQ